MTCEELYTIRIYCQLKNIHYVCFVKKKYIYLEIGQRLKELRKNLSQKEFSEKIGVPLVTYQKYDSGERMPPGAVLSRVAEICGKTVDYLLGREPLQMVISDAKELYLAEKKSLDDLKKKAEEHLYATKLLAILRGKNRKNASAIKENIDAFYETRDVVLGEVKKTNHAG